MPHAAGDSRASLTGRERLAGEGVPTACTTIEEVGSTGVGALTIGFLIFAVCTVVFLAKANTGYAAAQKALQDLMEGNAMVLKDPAPMTMVMALADSSVNINLRCWVSTSDYWNALWALNKGAKAAVEGAGCSIPFPQRDVHLFNEGNT